jgi:hypothetical protein
MKFAILVTLILSALSLITSFKKSLNNRKKRKSHKSKKVHHSLKKVIILGANKEDKEMIVTFHNELRNSIATTGAYNGVKLGFFATDMKQINWDVNLENKAQEHANKCVTSYSPQRDRRGNQFTQGESLYTLVTKGGDYVPDWKVAMNHWFSQINNFSKRKIRSFYFKGKSSYDFSQAIWSKTDKIGCGFNNGCVVPQGKMSIFVCHYAPIGNNVNHPVYLAENKVPPSISTPCPDGLPRSPKYPGLCCEQGVCIQVEEKKEEADDE